MTPPSQIGPYRVLDVLGSGAMGAVYRAEHVERGQVVALKTVAATDEALIPSIRREVAALSRLDHPGIVTVVDAGSDGGLPWLAMELVEGPTLRSYRNGLWQAPQVPLSTRPAVRVAGDEVASSVAAPRARVLAQPTAVLEPLRRLCAPLAYLHGEGLVHRDLKPANVILRGGVDPVLVDFGLSTPFRSSTGREPLDVGFIAAGTLPYMSPEALAGELTDARSDLYALGCMLYELLTGEPPFGASNAMEVARGHRERQPIPPSVRLPGLPAALDELVLGLLEKRPRDRVGYAADVARALEALGGAKPRPIAIAAPGKTYVYRPGFVGRDELMGRLMELSVGRVAAGRGGCLLLRGDSGVGKTRLAVELSRELASEGAWVITSPCERNGPALSGWLRPLQAIADRCRARGPDLATRWLGQRVAVLSAYQPALAHAGGEAVDDLPTITPGAAKRRLLDDLRETVAAVARDEILVVVLDDLHWADALTLDALAHLVEGGVCEATSLLLVATYRPEEAPPALAALAEREGVDVVDVEELSDAAVVDLVSDMLALRQAPDDFVRFVAEQTGGNPFFVAEYVRAALVEGVFARDTTGRWRLQRPGAEVELPRSLRKLVERRLDRAGPIARAVVDAAAALGEPVSPSLLQQVAEVDAATLNEAARELDALSVLEWRGPELAFAHDRYREVAYDRCDGERRLRLHDRAAAALETQASPEPGRIAHHFLAAEDEARALPWLLSAAAERWRQLDHDAAESAYRRALAIALDRGRTGEELTAREGLARVLMTCGRLTKACRELELARELARHDEERARLTGWLGDALFAAGRLVEAAGHLEDAAALAQVVSPSAETAAMRLRLLNRLTYIHYSFDYARCATTHARALLASRAIPETPERAQALAYQGPVMAGVSARLARRAGRRAIELCRRQGWPRAQMEAELMAAVTAMFLARWDDAGRHLRRTDALDRRVRDLSLRQVTREIEAAMHLRRGQPDDAEPAAKAALRLALEAGDRRGTVNARRHLALALVLADRLDEAGEQLDVAREEMARLDDHLIHVMLLAARGRFEQARDRRTDAEEALRHAVRIVRDHDLVQEEVVPAYYLLADVLVAGPRPDADDVDALLRWARLLAWRFPAHRGPTWRVRARWQARQGREAAALHRRADTAFAAWRVRDWLYQSPGTTRTSSDSR